jgi:uncharacterized protein (TIGR02145 family)
MKRLFLLASISSTILLSCSKNSNPKPSTTPSTTITITDSIKIGSQYWTTVNYAGTGGVSYNDNSSNDAIWGKLYTISEATSIKLPSGWRLPTTADFNAVIQTLDAGALKDAQGNYRGSYTDAASLMAKSYWFNGVGTNSSGFNAIPASYSTTNTYSSSGNTSTFNAAVYITSSLFTDATNGKVGHANFFIQQDIDPGSLITDAIITSIDEFNTFGQGRASIRFVRDN